MLSQQIVYRHGTIWIFGIEASVKDIVAYDIGIIVLNKKVHAIKLLKSA